jgi:intracellular sulfur oxidation DsrE/DsrF family protein
MFRLASATLVSLSAVTGAALAGPDAFEPGILIPEFGPVAEVDYDRPIPQGTVLRIRFDISTRAETGELNSTLTSAARFLNMHAAAGIPAEDIHVAVVIHGGAVHDVTVGDGEANAGLVAALNEHGVEIIVCGQSAAWYDVTSEDLQPGVSLALSAMTAHAVLHSEGYALNPF